jgi:hypothetical protein
MRAREAQLARTFWLRYPETIFIALFFFSSSWTEIQDNGKGDGESSGFL